MIINKGFIDLREECKHEWKEIETISYRDDHWDESINGWLSQGTYMLAYCPKCGLHKKFSLKDWNEYKGTVTKEKINNGKVIATFDPNKTATFTCEVAVGDWLKDYIETR